MLFKEFKTLVEFNTQDEQSKLPTKFSHWQLLIQQSIKRIADEVELKDLITNNPDDTLYRDITSDIELDEETDYFIKEVEKIANEDSIINIEESLVLAVVYDLSQMFTKSLELKQKYITDREAVINDYQWNKYTNMEILNGIN